MNKLHKKKEAEKNSDLVPDIQSQHLDIQSTSQMHYKKLSAYLLLLYQAFLRGETLLEPDIKMGLWRMIQLNNDFRSKIRMTHLDYLQRDITNLEAPWEELNETLFPERNAFDANTLNEKKDSLIKEYKETVTELLALNL